MASNNDLTTPEPAWSVTLIWPSLIAGLGMTALAFACHQVLGDSGIPVRVLLVVAGLIVTAFGVTTRLQTAGTTTHERCLTAGMVALGGLAALIGSTALNKEWDTAVLLLYVLTGVGLAGALIVLLPPVGRKIVVSLLVVYHFGGILCAVTSVPPPNGQAPWMIHQLWTRVYRNYLQFAYINNAYHFYSPDPGPASLLWFRIEYANRDYKWVRIPERVDFPTRMTYQRHLAMTESVVHSVQAPGNFDDLYQRRVNAGVQYRAHPDDKPDDVPLFHENLIPAISQRREPQSQCKLLLQSYVRHVAQMHPHPSDPSLAIDHIKVYRLVHNIIPPPDLANGISPLHPAYYLPIYKGTYNTDGRLLATHGPNRGQLLNGKQMGVDDPFLYWLIPVMQRQRKKDVFHERPGPIFPPVINPDGQEYEIVDCLRVHCGDTGRGKEIK